MVTFKDAREVFDYVLLQFNSLSTVRDANTIRSSLLKGDRSNDAVQVRHEVGDQGILRTLKEEDVVKCVYFPNAAVPLAHKYGDVMLHIS